MESPEPKPRRRLRVSLLSLMLLTTLVALSMSIAILKRQNDLLKREVTQLRNEVGVLDVGDPTKLHVLRAPDKEHEFKWRVWVPEGRKYHLRYSARDIPGEGFPVSSGGTELGTELMPAGEHVLTYSINKDKDHGAWTGKLTVPLDIGSQKVPIAVAQATHDDWIGEPTIENGVPRVTTAYGADETVVLIRRRLDLAPGSDGRQVTAAPGVMIWIETTN